MPTTYEDAPEVQEMARPIIARWHEELTGADIRYVWRVAKDPWSKGGKLCLGTAKPLNGATRHLARGAAAVITLCATSWRSLTPEQRTALLDHELSHLQLDRDDDGLPRADDQGRPILASVPHDLEEFRAVVERHGLWDGDLQRMAPVIAAQTRQLSLFEAAATDEPAGNGTDDADDADDTPAALDDPEGRAEDAEALDAALPDDVPAADDERVDPYRALIDLPGYAPRDDDRAWLTELHVRYPAVDLELAIEQCRDHWCERDLSAGLMRDAEHYHVGYSPRWRQRLTRWIALGRRPSEAALQEATV